MRRSFFESRRFFFIWSLIMNMDVGVNNDVADSSQDVSERDDTGSVDIVTRKPSLMKKRSSKKMIITNPIKDGDTSKTSSSNANSRVGVGSRRNSIALKRATELKNYSSMSNDRLENGFDDVDPVRDDVDDVSRRSFDIMDEKSHVEKDPPFTNDASYLESIEYENELQRKILLTSFATRHDIHRVSNDEDDALVAMLERVPDAIETNDEGEKKETIDAVENRSDSDQTTDFSVVFGNDVPSNVDVAMVGVVCDMASRHAVLTEKVCRDEANISMLINSHTDIAQKLEILLRAVADPSLNSNNNDVRTKSSVNDVRTDAIDATMRSGVNFFNLAKRISLLLSNEHLMASYAKRVRRSKSRPSSTISKKTATLSRFTSTKKRRSINHRDHRTNSKDSNEDDDTSSTFGGGGKNNGEKTNDGVATTSTEDDYYDPDEEFGSKSSLISEDETGDFFTSSSLIDMSDIDHAFEEYDALDHEEQQCVEWMINIFKENARLRQKVRKLKTKDESTIRQLTANNKEITMTLKEIRLDSESSRLAFISQINALKREKETLTAKLKVITDQTKAQQSENNLNKLKNASSMVSSNVTNNMRSNATTNVASIQQQQQQQVLLKNALNSRGETLSSSLSTGLEPEKKRQENMLLKSVDRSAKRLNLPTISGGIHSSDVMSETLLTTFSDCWTTK